MPMKIRILLAAGLGFAAAGCGSESPAENKAEALEEAAEYSTPAAADVLENAAEEIREENITEPGVTQDALEAAGNAQAAAGNGQ